MNQATAKTMDSVADANWLNWLPRIAGVLAAILIGSYIFTFQKLPVTENPAAWGTFGDYMGGLLNPLISLFTLIVAMQVWKLQKTELAETQKAPKEQAKTSEQQRQEQRFFDILNVYYRTVDSVSFTIRETGPYAKEPEKFRGKFAIAGWLKASPTIRDFLLNRGSSTPGKGYDPKASHHSAFTLYQHQ